MTRGRKKKPTLIKLAEGNPGKRKIALENEPFPETRLPPPPSVLSTEAVNEWNRLGPWLLNNHLISDGDLAAFAGYCEAFARWWEATKKIKDEHGNLKLLGLDAKTGEVKRNPYLREAKAAAAELRQWLPHFGLSPSTRSGLKVASKNDKENPWEEWKKKYGVQA